TGFTYADMARAPEQAISKLAAARASVEDTSGLPPRPDGFLEVELSLAGGASRGRLEIRLGRRSRQRRRRRRLALGLARRLRRPAPEPRPLLLELDPETGELSLDLADRPFPLVELLPLGGGERPLGLGRGDGPGEVALVRAGGERRPVVLGLAHQPLLELGDAPRPLGERPLHLLDLGERLLVARPHVRQVVHRGSVA